MTIYIYIYIYYFLTFVTLSILVNISYFNTILLQLLIIRDKKRLEAVKNFKKYF